MPTTAGAIRNAMISLVEDIVPAVHSAQRFRAHREEAPSAFRDVMAKTPSGCLRRFSIRSLGDTNPPNVNDTLVQEVTETFVVEVAYPTDGRHGSKALTSLDDAISLDATKIERTIGPPGYATFANLIAPACVMWTVPNEREVDGPVTFLRLTYRVDYYRSLS